MQSQEILDLLSEYSKALSLLEQYDAGTLTKPKGAKAKFVLKYEDCVEIIKDVKAELVGKKGAGSLFGSERSRMLEGIVENLYQTFNKKELYDTVEEKAAHLLYLIIKDHPFSDGNKRLGAFLFVYFLYKNNYLHRESGLRHAKGLLRPADGGERKINNNALVALALLIAESNPKEKDAIVKIILRNGTSWSVHVKNRKGGPSNPLSKDEVIKKFEGNASLVLKGNDIDKIIEKGIIFLLIFTPLAFGGVQQWSIAVMEIVAFSIFFLYVIRNILGERPFFDDPPGGLITLFILFAAMIALVIFQMISLPEGILKLISPASLTTYSTFGNYPAGADHILNYNRRMAG